MNILMTGFEPFGEHNLNPSQLLIEALPDKFQDSVLIKDVLPVHHDLAPRKLTELLNVHQPDAVIAFGLAAGRAKISLERIAINLMDFSIADNAGMTVKNQPINESGPAAYFSTLPLSVMFTELNAAGFPAELSLTAGAYLCNQVFYTLMHELTRQNLSIPAGFVHLPALPELAAKSEKQVPSMSLDQILKAAHLMINILERASNP